MGLYDYSFRHYSPARKQWMTEDPIRYGHNWYAFAANDPVNQIDVLGLCTAEAGDTSATTEPTTLNKDDYLYPITSRTKKGVYRCDQYALYEAFEHRYDPRDDYGNRINFDSDDIPEIYTKFKQQNKKDFPPVNSGGFVFTYFRGGVPEHMQFYKREGDTVTVWETKGNLEPTSKPYTIDELRKIYEYKDAKWVPRSRLKE